MEVENKGQGLIRKQGKLRPDHTGEESERSEISVLCRDEGEMTLSGSQAGVATGQSAYPIFS